ncbi:unnamed protein product [Rotaria sordida]|uniref:Uncharacterized protein n=1 Tax=Rotaria sordida TaxID=392033 RepID=A0A815BSL8_9BILA|nr:unnamed protein product [Rotaria sordida]CAF1554912.1 unnamed protein product [Rotaria sordida]
MDDLAQKIVRDLTEIMKKVDDGLVPDDVVDKMEIIVDRMLAVIAFHEDQQTLSSSSSSSPSPLIIQEQEQINNRLSNDDHRETRTSRSKDD